MYMNKLKLIVPLVLACTILTSCTDVTKTKQEVQNALTKQIDMKNDVFSGTIDLDLGNLIPQSTNNNTITNSLIGILQNSKITWQGVENTNPLQMEVDIKATPAALGTTLDLPILLKDNKLYMNIPLLNTQGKYFSVDLGTDGSGNGQKDALTPDSLKSVTQVTYQISSMLVTDLDPKWFTQVDEPTALKGAQQSNTIIVNIDDANKAEFSKIVQANFPSFIDTFAKSGIITPNQAVLFKQQNITSLQVQSPSKIAITIDESGFIRTFSIQMNFTLHDAAGTAVKHHINLQQSYEQINQNPKFSMPIPSETMPLSDVLKMLQPQK